MASDTLGSTVHPGMKGRQTRFSWPALTWPVLIEAAISNIQVQRQNSMLWVPVFLVCGNWIYFEQGHEPSVWLAVLILIGAGGLFAFKSRSAAVAIIALVFCGFAFAKLREEMIHTPLLRGPTTGVIVGGYVADIENKGGERREVVVAVDEATGIPFDEIPNRVRVAATGVEHLQIGDYISFETYLAPLPRPVLPGGFDFGRMLYFQSIGATGRMIGQPSLEERPIPWQFEYRRVFRAIRSGISTRITAVIPGALGHLADAMVSGERSLIPAEMNTSLQISGLAHIISISGLHMSMVAGGVFWAVRALLALSPLMALRCPIKKIAAVVAMIFGLFYMLLADSGSATERSYIMIAVMFFAILVDRPAFSMRNLAIAAILILVFTPEESVGASFQMSFLAVMGLGAFFQWWNNPSRETKKMRKGRVQFWAQKIWHVLVASTLTTMVAGGTSSIAAAYHFGRLSPFSIVANGITLPIMGLFVMPPALLATLAMPLGLEYVPLKIMEFGLWLVMLVSDWVAHWEGANLLIAQPNIMGIILIFFGVTFVCIGIGAFRLAGVAVVLIGLLVTPLGQRPVLLIEDRAANVAILDGEGHYVFANAEKNKFVAQKWLQHNGETNTLTEAALRPGWDCVEGDCFSQMSNPSVAFLHREREATTPDYCPMVDILIADYPLHFACRNAKLRIDRFDVWRNGAYAVYRSGNQFRVETAKAMQGQRPWVYEPRKSIKN